MGPNDVIILDSTLAQRKQVVHGMLDDSEYFEVFCVEQILKNFDLSYEEILTGIIDGSDDGGIDGFYLFVDGDLLDEDADLAKYKKTPLVELYVIQSKQPATFTEKALDLAYATFSQILDFTKAPAKLEGLYSNPLIEKVQQFRNVYLSLATKHPDLHINFVYATKGDTTEIHPKVKYKGDLLTEHLRKLLPGSSATVVFWGARELLEFDSISNFPTQAKTALEWATLRIRGDENCSPGGRRPAKPSPPGCPVQALLGRDFFLKVPRLRISPVGSNAR